MANTVKKLPITPIPANTKPRKARPLGGFTAVICPKDEVEGDSIFNPGDILLWTMGGLVVLASVWFFTAAVEGVMKAGKYMEDALRYDAPEIVEGVSDLAGEQKERLNDLKAGRVPAPVEYEPSEARPPYKTPQQRLEERLKSSMKSLEQSTAPKRPAGEVGQF